MAAGYSGTPLWKKLGVRDGQRTWRLAMPEHVAAEIGQDGLVPVLLETPCAPLEMAHLFVTDRAEFAAELARVREELVPDGTIWVSWPKKSAKIPTEVNEDVVREEAFPLGLVDVKVCAVDDTWSGLKLVIRRANR